LEAVKKVAKTCPNKQAGVNLKNFTESNSWTFC